MNGIIVVNKEEGYTSHDVVSCMRGILHMKKIGHTGTLDPIASGVLPVAVGKGTGLCELLTEKQKGYEVLFHLGETTDTQDRTGRVLTRMPVDVTEEEVRCAAASFLGEQEQVPPMYSALKVNGKKLYELAREGKTVKRAPRKVFFYEIDILETALPKVRMQVVCSKGTYIRTLCHDIGERLGCGAVMDELTRTFSGSFTLSQAHTLEEIRQLVQAGRAQEVLIGTEEILAEYPAVKADQAADILLRNGNPVPLSLTDCTRPEEGLSVRMYLSDGTFTGLYRAEPSRERWKPVRIFADAGDRKE